MLTGVAFVYHTNEIHELIFQVTGITIWNRSVYLFDRIPDTVNWCEVLFYVAIAIAAGFIGAITPAIIAGLQDPGSGRCTMNNPTLPPTPPSGTCQNSEFRIQNSPRAPS